MSRFLRSCSCPSPAARLSASTGRRVRAHLSLPSRMMTTGSIRHAHKAPLSDPLQRTRQQLSLACAAVSAMHNGPQHREIRREWGRSCLPGRPRQLAAIWLTPRVLLSRLCIALSSANRAVAAND